MEKIEIALSDGTVLKVEVNGNNYISKETISEDTFDGNLSEVTIDGTSYENMVLVQLVEHEDGTYWFVLREKSDYEIENEKLRSDIEFLALETNITL